MRVLFMGTPELAAVCLERLTREKDLEITVVSQPDKPQGRHMTLTPPAVKTTAQAHGLPVFQPPRLKDGAFEEELKRIDPEIIVVVAYGKILPPYILNYPKYRCINLHGSLLPAFRGAAPMQRQIMEGVRAYGLTTMLMDEGCDTGDMLETWSTPLLDEDDFGVVHDNMAKYGSELLLHTLRAWIAGELAPQKQDDSRATYAPKIEKADCLVDFSRSAREVHNQIRGLSPIPLAYTTLRGKNIKIIRSQIKDEELTIGRPGDVISENADGILVACGRGLLRITDLRPEGKGSMTAADFVKGRGVSPGDRFGE